jgi:FO synthase
VALSTKALIKESSKPTKQRANTVSNNKLINRALRGRRIANRDALSLAECDDLNTLSAAASELRDRGYGGVISYSPKVFIPLTQLCRDVCHYCTFAQTPKKLEQPYLLPEQVLDIARRGKEAGCHEALFTLGDKPELRYSAARKALAEMGYGTTVEYLAAMAELVWRETGLLPHLNPGVMSTAEMQSLRPFAVSMGIMLESGSNRLMQKGGPHYGSPDKSPGLRLATMAAAGSLNIPLTSGILIGIGETRRERVEALLSLRDLHDAYGHLQEIIVQNFRAKAGTLMSEAPEPGSEELQWTIALARLIFGSHMSIQAPPNLSLENMEALLHAGINDWGGVSPVTPDHVNPEAPWPAVQRLAGITASAGKNLVARLPLYPAYIDKLDQWVDPQLRGSVLAHMEATGMARPNNWSPGAGSPIPLDEVPRCPAQISSMAALLNKAQSGRELTETEVTHLFGARGKDYDSLCRAADELRQELCGDRVSYAVNRNINYTNICYYRCQFCAFSKGRSNDSLRGKGYDLPLEEVQQRCLQAWERGATEVCLQGGIHPAYTGQTYLDITRAIKSVLPDMHIHAFSALEVFQGAETLGISTREFLQQLKAAGLGSMPGTAAEILDDEVRRTLCADKVTTQQWLDVIACAHEVGLKTTATIMFGHIERPQHWSRHLLRLKELQRRSGGFTEFVPLPYVHMEAPLFRKGGSRKGPTFREAVLMHAVPRLVLNRDIPNIQASWVKMGVDGVGVCLDAGVNDLGGTLMNESISRAAGAAHGQELTAAQMRRLIRSKGRAPWQRTTLYADAPIQDNLLETVNL